MLLMTLVVPMMVLAGSNLQPVTALDINGSNAGAGQRVDGGNPNGPVALVGTIDTIGGTTYDWQANGPSLRWLVYSSGYGVHALWMYSADNTTGFPDRNMRYNFYDEAVGSWNWIDPDFMQSGVNTYTARCGYGNLDADPSSGVAVVASHLGTPIRVDGARDMAPGAGIFEYASGTPATEGYLWPVISVGQTSKVHAAVIDDATRLGLYYTKCDPWPTWATPVGMASPQPEPEFPTQSTGASKLSEKVCVTWEYSAGAPDPGFYRISTDGGASWGNPEELPWPEAYGTDTSTSYHITAMQPFYDKDDQLHIVAGVMPYVAGQGYIIPAQIWHWSPDNTPNWSRITIATCDPANLLAAVGYNATYACRPTIGEGPNGNLYVAWEQFDSSNVEPGPPEVLRADIFVAGSNDNGATWGNSVKITEAGTSSCRFPSIMDKTIMLGTEENLAVTYEIDQQAGFFVQGEGPATQNPVVVHWVPTAIVGIAEPPHRPQPVRTEVKASPNPFGGRTEISYALPRATDVSLVVYDAAGRPVADLASGHREAGRYTATWDARGLAGGIYFYTLNTDETSLSEKLIVVH